MNKLYGTIVGGAVGLIIGIIGLLLLSKPVIMIIITIVLIIIGAIIGYFMIGKKETIKMPTNAVPPQNDKN